MGVGVGVGRGWVGGDGDKTFCHLPPKSNFLHLYKLVWGIFLSIFQTFCCQKVLSYYRTQWWTIWPGIEQVRSTSCVLGIAMFLNEPLLWIQGIQ